MTNENKKNNTDDLINQLCEDLKEVSPRCPYRSISLWLLLCAVYIVGVVLYSGPAIDMQDYMIKASFIFEMSMAVAILFASALASSWLSFPDCIQRDWMKIIATTLFGTFLLWIAASGLEEFYAGDVDGSIFFLKSCSRGLAVVFIPLIELVYLSSRGNTTQPYWSITMNIMAVSALGWIGLRLTCPMYDNMTYGFLHYMLPFTILGAGIGFFARRLFKW